MNLKQRIERLEKGKPGPVPQEGKTLEELEKETLEWIGVSSWDEVSDDLLLELMRMTDPNGDDSIQDEAVNPALFNSGKV